MNTFTEAYRQRVGQERTRLLASLATPEEHQAMVLAELLAANAPTAFGRAHGLAAGMSLDDYRRAVPIRGHEEFTPWTDRVVNGESGVLTAEDPTVFFSSSGTTGQEKRIPVTPTYLRRCFLPFYFSGLAGLAERPGVLDGADTVLNLWQDPHSPIKRTEGGQPHIGPSQLDYGRLGEDLAIGLGNRAPWSVLPDRFAAADPWERTYLRLRIAAQHDIRAVIAVNPAIAAALPYQLSLFMPRLTAEIAAGTLGGEPYCAPDPARARELAGATRPCEAWPRLETVLTWTSYVAELYLPRLMADYGPGVQVLPAPIGSSEGPLAVPMGDHPTAGPLMVTSCLYEFLPVEQAIRPDSKTLLAHELENGREYHVVLSHLGGLYRCATRDIVRVEDFADRTPMVSYAGRNGVLSVAGEVLREAQALRAVARAGQNVRNLSWRIAPDGLRHEIAIAFDGGPFNGLQEYVKRLDAELAAESPQYRQARERGGLEMPSVQAVRPEVFLRNWRARVQAGERPPRVKDRVFRTQGVGVT